MVYGGGEAEGLFLSIEDKGSLHSIISAYAAAHPHLHASTSTATPPITVVTDGSRILGLGDLGIGGIGISIGKLCLYVLGGGVRADGVIPVVLDMGTNNQTLLDDPLYLGLRRNRPSLEEATEFMDEFMIAMNDIFPGIIVQHEDFESEKAFHFLERYQNKYSMFNDDIQGTGSVIFSGFTNAARFSCAASGKTAQDHKVVFLGGGSAAVGVAKQMMTYFTLNGLSEQEARERFWLVDTKGLITADRADTVAGKLAKHKEYFVRRDNQGQQFKTLEEVIEYVKPTALVGLSTTYNAFKEPMVRRMAELNQAPIIFPLSNPTTKCELAFEDALNWTDGRVLYASGSPYDPVEYGGKVREAGQGNNFLVFPGIGLGALFCGATRITDMMITISGVALADALNPSEKADGLLYPRLSSERIREVSAEIALRVVRQAQKEGVDGRNEYRSMDDEELLETIKQRQWHPAADSDSDQFSKL
jgi:malate dehydrogenase (oxaloacetate-decarboxylating)(NADP+)